VKCLHFVYRLSSFEGAGKVLEQAEAERDTCKKLYEDKNLDLNYLTLNQGSEDRAF
jgi:hypothetical protein